MGKELLSLIRFARSGSEEAFADLAMQYKPLTESMARLYYKKYSGELYTEEDFLQEAALGLYSAVCSYNESEEVTFGLYAKICVRNRLVSLLRSASKKTKKTSGRGVEYTEPSHRLLEKENLKQFEKKIEAVLSGLEWSVFCLYIQRKSYADMAKELGRTEKTIDNALYRIKKKLKALK